MTEQATPKAKKFRIGWWTLLGVLLAIAGGVWLLLVETNLPEPVIESIRISESATINNPGGATDSAIERLKRTLSKPDYYLVIQTAQGEQTTPVRYNTPIGNGLTFQLPTKAPLSSIHEVRVMHSSMLADPIVDRVDVSALQHEGQLFTFYLLPVALDAGRWNVNLIGGWSLVGLGGLLVLSTIARFVWQQVV
ncbi:MAG: hypothetical protein IT445_00800 [Phycisphaeraceae bacterium]|nr:hypothetical protein [Phycisphaeraceae bacterium]